MANTIRARQRGISRLEFVVNDFAGGFVSQAATYNIRERYLADIQNMELVQGMWQKRKGYTLVGSFTGVGSTPHTNKGMHIFNSQGNFHLLAVYDTSLYDTYLITKENGGKRVTPYLPETERFRFADFRNYVYIATGQTGLLKYDGNQIKEVASPVGSLVTIFDNRLLLAGIKGDDLAVYFSQPGDADRWDPLDYFVLDGGSNERITALVPLQGKLFIFTNQSIYSLAGDMTNFAVTKEVDGIGAISAEALTICGNRLYFISDAGKIYEFDGGSFPLEISAPISLFLESRFSYNALKYAATTSYKGAVWFTLDNSIVPQERITLVYYPDFQAWTKFTNIPAAAYVKLGNTLFFTGVHNEGSIYQYDTSYKDDAGLIDAYMKTTKWSFDYLENIKRFKELYVRGAIQGGGGNGFDIDFYVDDVKSATVRVTSDIATPTEMWGQNQWGQMYWGYAAETAGTIWGRANWGSFSWNSAQARLIPKWGHVVWNTFRWGDNAQGSLPSDVGNIERKLYLSQYNIISGKTLQLVFRDRTPNHGFRVEQLTLEYIQKGVR